MKLPHRVSIATTALVMLLTAAFLNQRAAAQEVPEITELSYVDNQYMQEQRDALDTLARNSLGRQFKGETESDLKLLQALLDEKLVRPDQVRELQGMGILLGDLLANDLDMHWVIYEDRRGRSRALRYKNSQEYLFPVTMISRRQTVGNDKPVAEIYDKAYAIIDPLRSQLPFQ
jgi:Domain of unknown function (DUF3806)